VNLKTRIRRLEDAAGSHSAVQNERFAEECICFPEDEPPKFAWQVEADIAAAVTCSLHGQRFSRVADIIHVYRPRWARELQPDYEETSSDGLFFGSPQYVKAMRVSLPPERFWGNWGSRIGGLQFLAFTARDLQFIAHLCTDILTFSSLVTPASIVNGLPVQTTAR
jgi:hypothetical protein